MKEWTALSGMLVLLCGCVALPESLAGGTVERVATGFRFTEGPVWHADGYLIFSDIQGNTIYKLENGEKKVFRQPSDNSNGLAFDLQGRLLACENAGRRVSRTLKDGTVQAIATHYEGKRLNSPNDLAVKSDGAVYFTDPPYGVRPEDRELDFAGVYRIDPKSGDVSLVVGDLAMPNGIAFSPDEKTLYVADTERHFVFAYNVLKDGSVSEGRLFASAPAPNRWVGPDGMAVDIKGNLYVATPDGVRIYDPKGKEIGLVPTEKGATNCAFGGPDGATLYITAQDSLYSVAMKYPGALYARRFSEKVEGERMKDEE